MNNEEMLAAWQQHYSGDQENLYGNFLVRAVFDPGHRYIAARTRRITGLILDVGSGMGYHLRFERFPETRRYICLDNSPAMLQRITVPTVCRAAGTCGQLPFMDNSIDAIIASHVLEHLPNLRRDLKELRRVLKPDGVLLVVLPCDPGWLWKLLTSISPSRRRLRKLGIDYDAVMRHEHVNSYQTCLDLLREEFAISDDLFYPALLRNHNLNILHCLTLSAHGRPAPPSARLAR
jgi:SAM-dependent methyltransferase